MIFLYSLASSVLSSLYKKNIESNIMVKNLVIESTSSLPSIKGFAKPFDKIAFMTLSYGAIILGLLSVSSKPDLDNKLPWHILKHLINIWFLLS